MWRASSTGCSAVVWAAALAMAAAAAAEPWARHTVDNSLRGADGVRLLDVNGDGRLDIATGWEESGVIRVYFHPGPGEVRAPWPAVTVGEAASPEDAVFVDLDGDGAVDVVSACEGKTRSLFVHWAPQSGRDWRTEAIPAARGAMQWMFVLPMQVDGRRGIDLAAGAKGPGAQIGWFEAPENPRDLAAWKYHTMRPAGWIMSLVAADMDGDGDLDVLASDRKGPASGVFWLENPGPGAEQYRPWRVHAVGAAGREVMFLSQADLDEDGMTDVLTAVKPREIVVHRRLSADGRKWQESVIGLPESAGTAKAVRAADIDLDGAIDLVFTGEQAHGEKSGVMWLSGAAAWRPHDISGPEGVKFDLLELLDLDGDGDLDLLTCEEAAGLGVVWYENPARQAKP
jgi:hypothetical protein